MSDEPIPQSGPDAPGSDELLRLVVESTIDFAILATDGAGRIRIYLAIYEIAGDELRACIARTGGGRPTEFTAGAESGRALAIYRRIPPTK